MAQFQVTDSFVLEQPAMLVLVGSIIENTIRRGMVACLPIGGHSELRLPIYSIEFALRQGTDWPCLCFTSDEARSLSAASRAALHGKIIEIRSAT
jgi:hypothetical protein